jgi:protein phosphatase 1L
METYIQARDNDMWYDISNNTIVDHKFALRLMSEKKRIGQQASKLLGTHTKQIRSFEMNMNKANNSSLETMVDVIDRWTKDTMVIIPNSMISRSSLLSSLEYSKIPFYNWEEFGGLAVVLSRHHRGEVLQALSTEGVKVSYQSREVLEQNWRNSQIETSEYQISRKGQDRFFQLAENGVIISLLFDGHGTDTVIDYISSHRTDFAELGMEPFPETNAEAFERTRKVFVEFENTMRKSMSDLYSGSTLVTAVHKVSTKKVFFAHIGDSRAVWSVGGKIYGTNDHKPSEEREMTRIISLGGKVTKAKRDVMRVNENLATSRSFGDETLKTKGNTENDRNNDLVSVIPSVYGPFSLPSKSFYGLGSDGVFDVMSNEETIKLLSDQKKSSNVARKVVEMAVQKGSLDDITFGCVHVL